MDSSLLKKIGLSEGEAAVYEYLLENGESTAGAIAKKIPLKRGNLYNMLKNLVFKGLIQQFSKNNIAHFRLEYPEKLKEQIEKSRKEMEASEKQLNDALPSVISQYNMAYSRPVVRYFEGQEGVKKVLEDSLSSKTEIYSYADLESINRYIADVNRNYVNKRERIGVKKKGIVFDTPFARKFLKDYYPGVTETRLIKYGAPPYHTVMQMYDGKISYITLSEKALIGVIIEDVNIYQMHKHLFEYLWAASRTPNPTVKS